MSGVTDWQPAGSDLRLGPAEVHVWRAGLVVDEAELERLAAFLSPDEHERARRFRLPELRRRFVATRGILRELLGHYLQSPPAHFRFQQNEHGKPFLAAAHSADLRFNVSHSRELAL